jgi:hypothetical protein
MRLRFTCTLGMGKYSRIIPARLGLRAGAVYALEANGKPSLAGAVVQPRAWPESDCGARDVIRGPGEHQRKLLQR